MKKLVLVGAIVFSLTACSSGWNCKARYVKSDNLKKKETHRVA